MLRFRRWTLSSGTTASTSFEYSPLGRALARQRDDVVAWEFAHDENGNVITAGFEVGETRFDVEHGSRDAFQCFLEFTNTFHPLIHTHTKHAHDTTEKCL